MSFIKKNLFFIQEHGIVVSIRVSIYELTNLFTSYFFPQFSILGRRKHLTGLLQSTFKNVVQGSHLKGLQLASSSAWDNCSVSSQIVGIYEHQLNRIIFSEKTKGATLIDVGAADGYYGVGCVFSKHFTKSVCYDIDITSQSAIKKLAILNSVQDLVEVNGVATTEEILEKMSEINKENMLCFLLLDIEGAEYELLNPEFIKMLSPYNFELLIELHEFNKEHRKKANELINNLKSIFKVEVVREGSRDPYQYVNLDYLKLTQTDKWLLCSESRPNDMRWLYIRK